MDASRVRQAAGRIAGRVHRTPVLGSATLEALTGAKLAIKNEAFQKTGSFKARGALNRVLTTPPDALARGLIGVSAGNHAAALAWAGSAAGARVTVVMPATAHPRKVAACRGYGAEVVLHGDTTTEAFEEGARLRRGRAGGGGGSGGGAGGSWSTRSTTRRSWPGRGRQGWSWPRAPGRSTCW